jgi:hypothetical protein
MTSPSESNPSDYKKPVSTGSRRATLYGLSISAGFIAVLIIVTVAWNQYISLPAIMFFASIIFGVVSQFAICKNIDIMAVFKLSYILPLGTFIGFLLGSKVKFMAGPIRAMFPSADEETIMKYSTIFYGGWGAIYGQLMFGGKLQACPSST